MLRKTEYSGIFHNGSVTLPPAGSTLGFFSNIRFLEELGPPNDWASLEFLSLRLAHIEPPANLLITFYAFLPSAREVSALLNYDSLYQPQFSSVPQSCPTLCDLMDCSTPGLPVHRQLPEFTQTHVH